MSKQHITLNLTALLSLLLPSCDTALATIPPDEAGDQGASGVDGPPSPPSHDDLLSVRAYPQYLDLTQNDGDLSEGQDVRIRIVGDSIYDSRLLDGSEHSGDRVFYSPTMRDLGSWATAAEPFPVNDDFYYVVLVDGQEVGGLTQVSIEVTPYLYVDAFEGHDANVGTLGAPLKTITRALQMARPYSTVKVNPGTYDQQNGELFPLTIDYPVTLHGDPANRGGADLSPGQGPSTRISGSELYDLLGQPIPFALVALGAEVTINGFEFVGEPLVVESQEVLSFGVLLQGEKHQLLNSSFRHTGVGAFALHGESTLIEGCKMTDGNIGIFGHEMLTNNRVRGCEISHNHRGIFLERVNGFDLGTTDDLGNNVIVDNRVGFHVSNDMWSDQKASGNTWNEIPLLTGDLSYLEGDGLVCDVLETQYERIDYSFGSAAQ